MHSREIVEYIEKELEKGFHIDDIKRALASVGHDVRVIEDSVLHVHNRRQKREKMRRMLGITTPLLVLLIIIIFVFYFAINKDAPGPIPGTGTGTTEASGNANAGSTGTGNAGGSGAIPTIFGTDSEVFEQALAVREPEYCFSIEDSEMQATCFAVTSKPTAVENAQQYSISDLDAFEQALGNQDNSKCSMIASIELKANCMLITSPPEVKEFKKVLEEDNSNFEQALTTRDDSYCSKIIDTEIRDQCNLIV